MQIKRIEVVGFGCLTRHELSFEPERVNLILAPNEAGKSTLLAAVEIALYGFPSARFQDGRELRQCYRPWSGGSSRIVLEMRDERHVYSIEYDYLDEAGNTIEKCTVRRDHRDVTDEMLGQADCPGLWLLKLSRDDFRRSVLVRQGDLESISRDTAGLVRHLESIVTSADAGASAAAAQQRLAEAIEDYRELARLQRWSSNYLSQAKQWPRVEAKLSRVIEEYESEKASLQRRRDSLNEQIEAFEQNKDQLANLVKACDVLHVLEQAARKRELMDALDKNDELTRQIETLAEQLESYEDVEAFLPEYEKTLAPLIERENQLRMQLDEMNASRKRAEEQITDNKRQRAQLDSISILVDQSDPLREQLTLFAQSITDERAWRNRKSQELNKLESQGQPLKRMQEARACYGSLTEVEREKVRNFELERLNINRRRQDAKTSLDNAQRQLEQIMHRRQSRRRLAIITLIIALLAGGFAIAWGMGSGVAITALVVMFVVFATSVMLFLNTRQLDAYRYDQLSDDISQTRKTCEQLDLDESHRQQQLEQIAAKAGLSTSDLVEMVGFYLTHHDKLEACDRIENRLTEAYEEVQGHRRRWSIWLSDAGQNISVDKVAFEMAESLVQKVEGLKNLNAQASTLNNRLDELNAQVNKQRTACRNVQEQIATLLDKVGVALVLPAPADELAGAEEIVITRREFDRLAKRSAQRQELVGKRESLRQQLLPDTQRMNLQGRLARLDQEMSQLTADIGSADKALAWLQSNSDQFAGADCFTDCRLDTLVSEDVARMREQYHKNLESLQSEQTHTWQQVRGFLKDYVSRTKHLDNELIGLKTELQRGQRFAEAVTIAGETLRHVQSNSYERWSSLLSNHLGPLLADLLPGYRLEGVAEDLSPVLVHLESGLRLDLERTQMHLSRGAKDRLFLAMRLALAVALGQERGVRLPMLLDDPLANWDDEALLSGMRVLAELHSRAGSLMVFSCQRSRFEQFIHNASDITAAISVRDFR